MVRITILAEAPLGYPDSNISINIPKEGVLEREIDHIPEGQLELTTFTEYYGYSGRHAPSTPPRNFPAVRIGNFYMLWIEERKEWVGINYEYKGSTYEQNVWGGGVDEDIYAPGPYRLNQSCAKLIRQAYGILSSSLEEILHTPPCKLEELASQK